MIPSSKQSGFSLVETLVAITILLVVIVGPMSISSSAARSTSYSGEQVIAFFLAQEGAELAQKARDDLQLEYFADSTANPNPWDDFVGSSPPNVTDIDNECFGSGGCGLQFANTNSQTGELDPPRSCSASGNPCRLYVNDAPARARYTHQVIGSSTPYTRTIYMTETAAGREVEVISRVTWQTGNQRQEQVAEVKTYLFNVYQN